jgi:serpin B
MTSKPIPQSASNDRSRRSRFSRSLITLVPAATAALLLFFNAGIGCDGKEPDTAVDAPPPGQLIRSSKPRLTTIAVPLEETRQLTSDNTTFALDVLEKKAGDSNFFISPHSISIALAMTYAGARARTAEQMGQALHFTLGQERLHPAFGALDLELARRSATTPPTASDRGDAARSFKLNIVNALWGQSGYSFLGPYLDVLAENYGAGLSLLDFASDPEGSRTAINR